MEEASLTLLVVDHRKSKKDKAKRWAKFDQAAHSCRSLVSQICQGRECAQIVHGLDSRSKSAKVELLRGIDCSLARQQSHIEIHSVPQELVVLRLVGLRTRLQREIVYYY